MPANETLTLYDYWRSSACYRVRIALNLKGLHYASKPIHLLKDGGEQHSAAYREVNPQQAVPGTRRWRAHGPAVAGDHRIPR